mmetsp:Transcript_34861/g.81661  ORF Transcript_34861/g.81661 Transcript_34861/m.81661 type:complete len:202 (+) Transcript_34861:849-1454(+)
MPAAANDTGRVVRRPRACATTISTALASEHSVSSVLRQDETYQPPTRSRRCGRNMLIGGGWRGLLASAEECFNLLERLSGRLGHAHVEPDRTDSSARAVKPEGGRPRDGLFEREEADRHEEVGDPVDGGGDAHACGTQLQGVDLRVDEPRDGRHAYTEDDQVRCHRPKRDPTCAAARLTQAAIHGAAATHPVVEAKSCALK